MSYILDALKKAETERNLGEIPGIHAQPLHLAADTPERTWRHDPWRWLALVCVALLLGLAAWKWWPAGSEPAHPAIAPVPRPVPVAPQPTAEATPTVQTAQAPVPLPVPAVESTPVQDTPAAKPSRKSERRAKHSEPATQQAKPSRPKAAEETPVTAFRDLPFDVQRDIPALTIGGYIYSAVPADRSVLINQRLLREGDQISPGFTLVGIRPDGIVLDYRGRRFSEPY